MVPPPIPELNEVLASITRIEQFLRTVDHPWTAPLADSLFEDVYLEVEQLVVEVECWRWRTDCC